MGQVLLAGFAESASSPMPKRMPLQRLNRAQDKQERLAAVGAHRDVWNLDQSNWRRFSLPQVTKN